MEKKLNNYKKHPAIAKIILWVCIGILAAICFSAVFAVAVKYLWNWLMTDIFGLASINYFQAFGLVLLARLLVGGWHKGHHENRHFHHFFSRKTVNNSSNGYDFSEKKFHDYWEKEGKEAFERYLNSSSISRKSGE